MLSTRTMRTMSWIWYFSRAGSKAGMMPLPFLMIRRISNTSRLSTVWRKSGTLAESALAMGPSPLPPGPWQLAQRWA